MGSTVLSVSLILLISFITNVVATHQNDSVTQCDCQQAVEDLLRVRTDRLFNRIALERQLKNQVERSGQLNEDLLDETDLLEEVRNTSVWLQPLFLMIEASVRAEMENGTAAVRIRLDSLEELFNGGRNNLKASKKIKKTPEQVLIEQMNLVLFNLTREVTALRGQGLPDLERRLVGVERATYRRPRL